MKFAARVFNGQGHADNDDYRDLPIGNLDSVQPVDAPRDQGSSRDQCSSLDIPSGSSDEKHNEGPSSPKASLRSKLRRRCKRPSPRLIFQAILTFVVAMHTSRPMLTPVSVSSILRWFSNYQFLRSKFERFHARFGLDPEREKKAYDGIFNESKKVGQREQKCIRNGAAKCKANFDRSRTIESAKHNATRDSNARKLQQAAEAASLCKAKVRAAESKLQDLVFNDGVIPFTNRCSSIDRKELEAIAGGAAREERNVIKSIAREVEDFTESQLEYVADLAIYNKNYFFGRLPLLEANFLQNIEKLSVKGLEGISLLQVTGLEGFDGIIACVSPELGGSPLCTLPNVSISLQEVYNKAEAYIEVGNQQIQLAAMTIATLVDRHDWAITNIRELVRIFARLRDIFGRPFDLALNSLSGGGIDFSQFSNLYPGRYYVPGDLDFVTLPDLDSIEPILREFLNAVLKLKGKVTAVADQVSDEFRMEVNELATNIKEAFSSVFDDYNPPKHPGFDTTDANKIVQTISNQLRGKYDDLGDAISKVGKDTNALPENATFVPMVAAVALNATSAHVQDARAKILPLAVPDIPSWVWSFLDWLRNNLYKFDYVRIAWENVRDIRKVWDTTAVPVQKVIMPTTAQEAAKEKGPLGTFFTVITHDWIPKIVTRSLLLGAGAISGLLYYASFSHYQRSCVDSKNGTYIGRVLLANAVSTPIVGEINRVQETEALQVERYHREQCETARVANIIEQTQQVNELEVITKGYNASMTAAQQLIDCIAETDLDPDLDSCLLPLDVALEEAITLCDWGDCVIDCDQTYVTEEIQAIVIENECIIEEQTHNKIWLHAVVLMAWFGLGRLWDALRDLPPLLFPKWFGARTVAMELERNLETRELLGSEGMEAEEAMDKAIGRTLCWNRVKASGQLLVTLSYNGAWIAILVVLRRNNHNKID